MEDRGYIVMPAMGAEQTLEAFRRACQDPDFMDDMDALYMMERKHHQTLSCDDPAQLDEDNAYWRRVGEDAHEGIGRGVTP